MAAKKVTLKEYLDWLALENRLDKWGAYVAYDRDKCNHLILQEYIEKFNEKDGYMPPIDDTFYDGDTVWNWMYNCQTDAPRLSFENNPDAEGKNVAEANMSTRVVGGTDIQLTGSSENPQVIKIKSYGPLDRPELKADRVPLSDIKGTVDTDGMVVLDLGAPPVQRRVWELSGSRHPHERRLRGAFMKRKFLEAKPENRTFKIGQLANTGQHYLKPDRFESRIVMEEGANVAKASNFGNGALEIRIAMQGGPLGGTPGEDWLYPFPSDHPEINSSMMFNHDLLMAKVIGDSISRQFGIVGTAFVQDLDDAGPFKKYTATSNFGGAYLDVPELKFTTPGNLQVTVPGFKIYFHRDGNYGMVLEVVNGTVKVKCGFAHRPFPIRAKLPGQFDIEVPGLTLLMNAVTTFEITVHVDLRKLVVSQLSIGVGTSFGGELNNNNEKYVARELSTYPLGDYLEDHLRGVMDSLFTFDDIDAFVLNSILFGSTDAVRLQHAHLPGGLLVLGSISPRLTTFTIVPQEILLGHGASHLFVTSPDTKDVTWSVTNLDGSTLGAGDIDEKTGRYTAPGLDQIDGIFKRVKITATAGGHTSKALVTIITRAITLNPLVQYCESSSPTKAETVEFSANTSSGALKWSVTGGGAIPEAANPDRTNLYVAPLKQAFTDKTFTIDEVKVTNTETQMTQTSFVVVKDSIQTVALSVELEGLAPSQAQYIALFNGKPAPNAVWSCFPETGAGSIDPNGRYTADPTSHQQFVIIRVSSSIPEFDLFVGDGFFIQPLPLGPLPPKPDEPEEPQDSLE